MHTESQVGKMDRLYGKVTASNTNTMRKGAYKGSHMPAISWKEMFLVYDMLECILYLDFNFDFPGFYKRL
jgi:hypothetical protein